VTLDGRAVVVEVDVHADPPWPPEAAADAAALRDEAATTAGLVPWTVGLDWGSAGRAVVDGVTVDGWEADRDVWSARFAGVGVGVALAWSGVGR
jgi:hypothetical protein